jgi:glycosyltransferase involved in cell wall biosynthesis
MKFSVVIPTHNRLHLLRSAIETVRRQVGDWEVVVFDNASRGPVGEHVRSLGDPRVRCDRSNEFLPVTESWNRAMAMAQGDYVILLGDDDGLTPNYFHRIRDVIERFDQPDVIYTDIYQFWHSGVAPWRPEPHLLDVRHGFFFAGRDQPFKLSREEAVRAVTGSLRLRMNFSFNSQAFLYSRRFIERLRQRAPVFRSPFPDYYSANVALAKSRSTVVVPQPLAVAGVSKVSYGYAMYNDQEGKGDALLNTNYVHDPVYESVRSRLLPGPSYNTNFILAMEYVARDTRDEIGVEPDYERYRRMQILAILQARAAGRANASAWDDLRAHLSTSEFIWALGIKAIMHASYRMSFLRPSVDAKLADIASVIGVGPAPKHYGPNGHSNVVDVYEAFENGSVA